MADDAELASDYSDFMKDAHLSLLPKFNKPSLKECQECGEDIPPKRQLIGGVTRCFDCQNHLEKRR